MFMHPLLFAIGLGGAAIPLVVHWMTRPRPVRMPLSTIRLVNDALHQRRARHRLRDFLVLLSRCLAVALLAMAIARPLLDGDTRPSEGEQADRVKIVLLDASQSMAAIDGAATRFDSGRAAAATELGYKPNLAANLLIASHQPGAVFESPSANLRLLRDRLAETKVNASTCDASMALEEATRQFSTSKADAERELVIISDFQRANWARADFSKLPEDVSVRLISMARDQTPANLAIEQVRLSATPTAGKPVTLLIDVANHSEDLRNVTCELNLGSLTRSAEGKAQPRNNVTLQIDLEWPDAGWQWGRVRLVDTADAISADDELPIAIGVRRRTRVAIVTEARSGTASGAFFIKQALSNVEPDVEPDANAESTIANITPGMLDTPTAQAAMLWVVTDVEAWDESVAPRVAAWLRRGRAVLYVARGPADANNLRSLQEALGTEMQPAVELIASLDSDRRRDLRVKEFDRENRPFSEFGDSLASTASGWRIGGGSPTRSIDGAAIDSVAATLSDRSALLFFTDVGAGRLAVLNADLSASNLAFEAGFVPMLVETVARLTDNGGAVSGTRSGQAVVRDLPTDVSDPERITVIATTNPDSDEAVIGKIQSEDGTLVWNWPVATDPGIYRVADSDDRTLWAEAVRSDPAEQDLRSLSQEVLQQRLAGGRRLDYENSARSSAGQVDSLWVYATLAMLGCILGELTTLIWFRS